MANFYVRNAANTGWVEHTGLNVTPDANTFNVASGWVRNADNSAWVAISQHTIVESFESFDITQYRGETLDWEVTTAPPVHTGSYSLKSINSNTRELYTIPGTGHENFPQPGQTFGCWCQALSEGAAPMYYFGFQDTNAHYRVRFDQTDCRIIKFDPTTGLGTLNTAPTSGVTTNTWYFMETEWRTDGTMNLTIRDTGGVSVGATAATDTTFGAGGYGYRNAGASPRQVAFDHFIIYT